MTDLELIEQVAMEFTKKYLSKYENEDLQKTVEKITESEIEKVAQIPVLKDGRNLNEVVKELVEEIMPYGNNCSHHRFFGFIPGTASPLSWLGDLISSSYNRHLGSIANAPAVELIERKLIRWLNDKAGFPQTAGGTFVSGGSMANLTALTVARNKILNEDEWHLGVAYISNQTHSSVIKGLKVIGVSQKRIRIIPTNDNFEINTELLKNQIAQDLKSGLKPFVVVASSGTTNTGSVDDFKQIRSICDEYCMWLHVDGAFGASALLSEKYSCLLNGIETANSISWDAHKWLFQTLGCSMLLVRDEKDLLESFCVHPEYLEDIHSNDGHADPMDIGIELTRPARFIRLWLTLQVMGENLISKSITHGIDMAKYADDLISSNPNIKVISHAKLAVLNFRYIDHNYSKEENDLLNLKISQLALNEGYAGIFTTELNGEKVLRLCIINPRVTKEEIEQTVKKLEEYYHQAIK